MLSRRRRRWRLLLAGIVAATLVTACGGDAATSGYAPGPPLNGQAEAPAIPTNPLPAEGIVVPAGFVAYEYATGAKQPTSLAFDASGRLFVAEMAGRVKVVEDRDGDGVAEPPRTFWRDASKRIVLGLAVAPDGSVYVSATGDVLALRDTDADGRADEEHVLINELPHRVHQNNGLAFGPDGKLYVTNGSTCNLCREEDERSATILRSELDGGNLEVFARGLRNAYDLAFDAEGNLWATANEHDFFEPADEGLTLLRNPPEELNYIVEGGNYGWPDCAGRDREMAPGGCEGKTPPVVELEPHSSADGLVYYQGGNFPGQYQGSFFVAQYGSDPRSEIQTGRQVTRVQVTPTSEPPGFNASVTEFATGFERPLDVTMDALGTLYVADFESGKIYRIIWEES
jgi:putative membrane-bound dehydrogenase-like protein